MSTNEIAAASLTTFDVAADGSHARLHMRDRSGQPATLVLPVACLNELLMSLPRMIQVAIQRRYADESMRLVHALEGFKLEFGELDESAQNQFILTLVTTGGFTVSFSASAENLSSLGNAILEETPQHRIRCGDASLLS